jgi:hypothetical protein
VNIKSASFRKKLRFISEDSLYFSDYRTTVLKTTKPYFTVESWILTYPEFYYQANDEPLVRTACLIS